MDANEIINITRRDFLAGTSATAAGLLGAAALDQAGSLFSTAEAASRITLRFGMYSSPTWVPSYEQIFEHFMKLHPTIMVKPEWAPYAAWTQKIATEMASGTEPDVTILDWDDFYSVEGLSPASEREACRRIAECVARFEVDGAARSRLVRHVRRTLTNHELTCIRSAQARFTMPFAEQGASRIARYIVETLAAMTTAPD